MWLKLSRFKLQVDMRVTVVDRLRNMTKFRYFRRTLHGIGHFPESSHIHPRRGSSLPRVGGLHLGLVVQTFRTSRTCDQIDRGTVQT